MARSTVCIDYDYIIMQDIYDDIYCYFPESK